MNAQVEINDGDFVIDAELLGEMLAVPPQQVPMLMRHGIITSACERGVDDDEGEFRLSFFYRSRRARLNVDAAGRILRRSVLDFGDHPLPRSAHAG